ncbi:MAG TPA: exosortase [Bryobacteraceae bacterium]|nr:exosortase [Bryobacteraceae bacterium]
MPGQAPIVEPELHTGRLSWIVWVWSGVLLLASYAPVLWRLVQQWGTDPDVGHGFFVPMVAGFIAWQKRDELRALKPAPSWWGLALVLYGALQLYIATLGAELFLARTAFVISVAGIILLLGGKGRLRVLAFPMFVLLFMIPIPTVVYNSITFPLQLLASRVSTAALDVMQIPVLREGNVLELAQQKLSVVEACSGIRSLLSLTFLSVVYGYFFETRTWMRVVLFLSTIPIAIIANASRVTLTGVLTEYKPELAEGFFHTASGWVIFMVALGIMIVVHQILQRGYHFLQRRQGRVI